MANVAANPPRARRPAKKRKAPAGPTLDFATLVGAIGAFVVIGAAMTLGGSPGSFIDIPAMLIVLGGTFLVSSVSFSITEVVQAQRVMLQAVLYQVVEPDDAARHVLTLADHARKNGILAIQNTLKDLKTMPFLYRAAAMVIDGMPPEQVESILMREADAIRQRHIRSAGVLRRAGEVAPAMGLIGTLVGLVQMLGNLEDPSTIGPSMAIALLTTFYGAVLANMLFLPLANKLDRNSEAESMINQIYAIGIASISRQENPRRLEVELNTILPPARRVEYFD
ncbi:motility protein A [Denitrobaculum tricleocarpae]|uniref:Flagellar motor protein MotA n=1 Tax=Denitrobaculum tricleocarpae TaxID=2591009 RepID=A0A545T3U5_9PROT|nr:MotA/TolQ/ExbB proton channel family protein [Denitrobaculum tricleocarpae]TQV71889.1 flagellar motor protein MotA [Denitrobaculum tricleocarpae]